MDKKKILVSAYGCEPNKGSEPGVGWNWILQMAKDNDVYVITRNNNQEVIEANIPAELKDSLHFTYYDTNRALLKVKKKAKRLYFYYFFWQRGIKKVVKQLKQEIKFDYAIHLTFGSMWMSTSIAFCNIPYIWGPVGGADAVPKKYIKRFPFKQRIVQRFRYFLIKTSGINPRVVRPCKRAEAILCRTENNINALPKKYQNKTKLVLETAIDDEIFNYQKDYTDNNSTIEFITTGRLVPFKNVEMAVDIMGKLYSEYKNIHLTIIGSGPESKKINDKIKNQKLEGIIDVIDELPREQVISKLVSSDIYICPSLREGGSWSLMEAMAVGLPVVCLNWTGMKTITSEKSAIRIEPSNYEKSVDDFTKAAVELINSKDMRMKMGFSYRKINYVMHHIPDELRHRFTEENLKLVLELNQN